MQLHGWLNLRVSEDGKMASSSKTQAAQYAPDWDRAAEILDCLDWDSLLPSEINACWSAWRNYFMQAMEMCIPCAVAKVKKRPPWINQEILSAIRKRDITFRVAKSSGKSSDRAKYNRKRNQVVDMIRESKKAYFNHNLNGVNAKSFWKTVRMLNNSDISSIPTLSEWGRMAETSQAKAAVLNNFFYTCFNHEQPPLRDSQSEFSYPFHSSNEFPSEFLCSEESVLNMLIELDTTKSTGNDGISPKMLKCTAVSIARTLCKLFNMSISTGTFPSDWKVGRITPIPKGTDNQRPSGYRPISVLPVYYAN